MADNVNNDPNIEGGGGNDSFFNSLGDLFSSGASATGRTFSRAFKSPEGKNDIQNQSIIGSSVLGPLGSTVGAVSGFFGRQSRRAREAQEAEEAELERVRVESIFKEIGAAKQKQSILQGFGKNKTSKKSGLLGEQLQTSNTPTASKSSGSSSSSGDF